MVGAAVDFFTEEQAEILRRNGWHFGAIDKRQALIFRSYSSSVGDFWIKLPVDWEEVLQIMFDWKTNGTRDQE